MAEIILNEKNFSEEVFQSDKPVLVDFWSEYCPPCQLISPIIEKIAEDFQGKIKVGKLNVDQNPLIASSFMIEAIPTLLFFKNRKVVEKIVGLVSYEVIKEKIEKILEMEGEE